MKICVVPGKHVENTYITYKHITKLNISIKEIKAKQIIKNSYKSSIIYETEVESKLIHFLLKTFRFPFMNVSFLVRNKLLQ
jgi:hypothetical protein